MNKSNKKEGGRKTLRIDGIVGSVQASRLDYLRSICRSPNISLAARMTTIIQINGPEAVNHG